MSNASAYQLLFELSLSDFVIWVVYVLFGGFFLSVYQGFNLGNRSKFLVRGYLIKIIGGFAFALVYVYYYQGGDTVYYFEGIEKISSLFFKDVGLYFKVCFTGADEAMTMTPTLDFNYRSWAYDSEMWFLIRLLSPLALIGMKSFLGVTYLCSLLSFLGAWKMFEIMDKMLPNKQGITFGVNFYVLSVVFWGGGVMKDTITLFCLFYIVYRMYQLVFEKKYSLFGLFQIVLFSFVIFNLKAYVLFSLVPWVFITAYSIVIKNSNKQIIMLLLTPILTILMAVSIYFGTTILVDQSEKYQSEKLMNRVQGFHSWHTTLEGSSYSLGEVEYTPIGIISKIPEALNVTLFRPYPWEAKSFFILISSVESMFFLWIVVSTFFKVRLKFFKILSTSPFLLGSLVFCLFLSFIVGFSAYNFGALARFKIPMMSFFLFVIYFVREKHKELKSLE
jgi:hypothetical protein